MNLYFVRHGESVLARMDLISNRDLPYGLTGKGVAQTEALAKTLRKTSFTAHYSSTVPRARETSQILSNEVKLPVFYNPHLHEIDMGELEGRHGAGAMEREMKMYESWLIRGEADKRILGGENCFDIEKRFRSFIKMLETENYGGNSNVLIVAHAGLLMCMIPCLCPNLDKEFAYHHVPANCGIIHIAGDSGEYRCVKWNDIVME
jgi:probable phosphoglycerate mutase